MDAFISGKKRRLSSCTSPPRVSTSEADDFDEDETTDFKLALLSSLHPSVDKNTLLDVLLVYEGSVEKTAASLETPDSTQRKAGAVIGLQKSISSYIAPTTNTSSGGPSKRPKSLSRRGATLQLYSPEDVEAHTPCSIIHNFLPPDDANALLEELLGEVVTFERASFKLFDNVVHSPHTAGFFVESLEEQQKQKSEYIYNGGVVEDVRQLTPQMRIASPRVEEAVNAAIASRIKARHNGKKLKHQCPDRWRPNVAMVNCYKGGAESVGYHSDQLTYLGPRTTIGSISLGVAREFRVRRVVPQSADSKGKTRDDSDAEGQVAIHLPHNSLLVMHAEMQEEWKHSIAPAQAIDPHPISRNTRINITYRNYKANLHPRFTPRCKCNVPTTLRVVQKKKENWGRYFWMCYAGNAPGRDGCTYFEWAEFDDDGNPIWKKNKGAMEDVGKSLIDSNTLEPNPNKIA